MIAFFEGVRAFQDGDLLEDNPYRGGTLRFIDWQDGWIWARDEKNATDSNI